MLVETPAIAGRAGRLVLARVQGAAIRDVRRAAILRAEWQAMLGVARPVARRVRGRTNPAQGWQLERAGLRRRHRVAAAPRKGVVRHRAALLIARNKLSARHDGYSLVVSSNPISTDCLPQADYQMGCAHDVSAVTAAGQTVR